MSFIPAGITRAAFRTALVLKKNSPNLMFGVGLTGVVASTVMACRSTLQLADELPKMKHEIMDIKENAVAGSKEGDRDVAYVYAKHSIRVARLYAPAVLVGVSSVGLLTGSHITLNRRNAGLTAGYAALNKAYDEYRERVREELGEEQELNMYRGVTKKTVVGDDGKKKTVDVISGIRSPYARLFDEYSINWQKNAEYNRAFVQVQQTHANDLLHARGHIFLNEVYDMLGIERTPAGSQVGWVRDNGDNYVDFGLYEPVAEPFMNLHERSVLLDFNVDGVIYDKI